MSQRPNYDDEQINGAVAQDLAKLFPESISQGAPCDLEESLRLALQEEAPEYDAYKLAQELDRSHGWNCCTQDVHVLEGAFARAHGYLCKAIALWVKQNAIVARYQIGDLVRITAPDAQRKRCEHDGEVIAVDADQATYTVMIAALGHVRKGVGTHGLIVPYEQLHALATPPEQFSLSCQ
jgi:hypothetical protein